MSKVCSDLEWKVEVDADERIKRKAATQSDAKAAKRDRSSSNDNATPRKQDGNKKKRTSTKITIKRIREQRRIQARKDEAEKEKAKHNKLLLDNHPGNVIAPATSKATAPEDFFWEVEDVIGRRIHRGRVEYLIRWKGCTEDDHTWEPPANLCDTASK